MKVQMKTIAVLLMIVFSCIGCSSQSSILYPVAGKVTVDGEPMEAGSVALHPKGSTHAQSQYIAAGKVKKGRYEIFSGQRRGASPGFYKVLVVSTNFSGNPAPPTGGTIPMPKSLIDPIYGQLGKTPLSIEVVADPEAGAYDLEVTE